MSPVESSPPVLRKRRSQITAARPDDPGFEIVLDATRGEPANDNAPPEHGITLKAAIRW